MNMTWRQATDLLFGLLGSFQLSDEIALHFDLLQYLIARITHIPVQLYLEHEQVAGQLAGRAFCCTFHSISVQFGLNSHFSYMRLWSAV